MLTIWPVLRDLKCGSTSCMPYSADFTFTSIISSMSASVSSDGAREIPRPTLLTQTSTWPNRAIASRTTRAASSRRVMSAAMPMASPARAATVSSSDWRRATRTSRAPPRPSRSARAAPMPALAPVMTTTLSRMWPQRAREIVRPARADSRAADRIPVTIMLLSSDERPEGFRSRRARRIPVPLRRDRPAAAGPACAATRHPNRVRRLRRRWRWRTRSPYLEILPAEGQFHDACTMPCAPDTQENRRLVVHARIDRRLVRARQRGDCERRSLSISHVISCAVAAEVEKRPPPSITDR